MCKNRQKLQKNVSLEFLQIETPARTNLIGPPGRTSTFLRQPAEEDQ
jgi:hypothetical protein